MNTRSNAAQVAAYVDEKPFSRFKLDDQKQINEQQQPISLSQYSHSKDTERKRLLKKLQLVRMVENSKINSKSTTAATQFETKELSAVKSATDSTTLSNSNQNIQTSKHTLQQQQSNSSQDKCQNLIPGLYPKYLEEKIQSDQSQYEQVCSLHEQGYLLNDQQLLGVMGYLAKQVSRVHMGLMQAEKNGDLDNIIDKKDRLEQGGKEAGKDDVMKQDKEQPKKVTLYDVQKSFLNVFGGIDFDDIEKKLEQNGYALNGMQSKLGKIPKQNREINNKNLNCDSKQEKIASDESMQGVIQQHERLSSRNFNKESSSQITDDNYHPSQDAKGLVETRIVESQSGQVEQSFPKPKRVRTRNKHQVPSSTHNMESMPILDGKEKLNTQSQQEFSWKPKNAPVQLSNEKPTTQDQIHSYLGLYSPSTTVEGKYLQNNAAKTTPQTSSQVYRRTLIKRAAELSSTEYRTSEDSQIRNKQKNTTPSASNSMKEQSSSQNNGVQLGSKYRSQLNKYQDKSKRLSGGSALDGQFFQIADQKPDHKGLTGKTRSLIQKYESLNTIDTKSTQKVNNNLQRSQSVQAQSGLNQNQLLRRQFSTQSSVSGDVNQTSSSQISNFESFGRASDKFDQAKQQTQKTEQTRNLRKSPISGLFPSYSKSEKVANATLSKLVAQGSQQIVESSQLNKSKSTSESQYTFRALSDQEKKDINQNSGTHWQQLGYELTQPLLGNLLDDKKTLKQSRSARQEQQKDRQIHEKSIQASSSLQQLSITSNDGSALDKEISQYIKTLAPTQLEINAVQSCYQSVSQMLQASFPGSCCQVYGSFGSDLWLRSNMDLDLSLKSLYLSSTHQGKGQAVRRIAEIVRGRGYKNVQAVVHARVPICKFYCPSNKVKVDVSINNNLPSCNTQLLKTYCQICPQLRELIYFVKHWAKMRQINETYNYTISSYGYSLLAIFYMQVKMGLPSLQNIGQRSPVYLDGYNVDFCKDLDVIQQYYKHTNVEIYSLILGFFKFYMNYLQDQRKEYIISVREGILISQQTRLQFGSILQSNEFIVIEDPFQNDHNLGKYLNSYTFDIVQHEFENAYKIMQGNNKNWKRNLFDSSYTGYYPF